MEVFKELQTRHEAAKAAVMSFLEGMQKAAAHLCFRHWVHYKEQEALHRQHSNLKSDLDALGDDAAKKYDTLAKLATAAKTSVELAVRKWELGATHALKMEVFACWHKHTIRWVSHRSGKQAVKAEAYKWLEGEKRGRLHATFSAWIAEATHAAKHRHEGERSKSCSLRLVHHIVVARALHCLNSNFATWRGRARMNRKCQSWIGLHSSICDHIIERSVSLHSLLIWRQEAIRSRTEVQVQDAVQRAVDAEKKSLHLVNRNGSLERRAIACVLTSETRMDEATEIIEDSYNGVDHFVQELKSSDVVLNQLESEVAVLENWMVSLTGARTQRQLNSELRSNMPSYDMFEGSTNILPPEGIVGSGARTRF